jgi:hypothetical protein
MWLGWCGGQRGYTSAWGETTYFHAMVDSSLSLSGAASCGIIGWHLDRVTKIVGGIEFLIGLIDLTIITQGFSAPPRMTDFGESA